MAAEDVGAAAKAADIAGGKEQDAARANIGGAGRELGLAHRPDQGRGFFLGEDLGDPLELRLRHAGDALDFIRVPLLDLLADVVHAVDALTDEFLVFPAVLEDVPEHPIDHRDVGAWPHAHVLGRMRRGAREARLDDDEVRPVDLLADQQVLQRHRMGFGRIAAHDDQRLGVLDVVVAVGHRAVAPGIGNPGDGGRMADARLVVDRVGAPEGCEFAAEIGALVGEFCRAEPVDRLRARLLADRKQLGADLVDGLVPAHFGPLAVDELHRIFEPAVAVHQFAHRRALRAMRAAVDGTVPARFLADPHAVRHFGHDRAADRAVGADVLADGHRCAGSRRRPGLGLAHGRERQRAERREAAGDETRPAQEAAAIETAIRWARERGGKRAATDLTFRPPDQHGRLLLSNG